MLRVDYTKRMGEWIIKGGDGEEYKQTLCGCNGLCAMMHFYTDDKGVDMVQLCSFFADEEHAKNCLGLSKGTTNIYEDCLVRVRLNTAYKESRKLAAMLVKAFDAITIELYNGGELLR